MKKSRIINGTSSAMVAFSVALVPCGAAAIINEDFESLAAGARPATVLVNGNEQETGLRPNVNTPADPKVLAQVVSGTANTAGGGVGNGLQLIDDDLSPVPADSTTGYEVDVVPALGSNPVSNLHVSFDIAWTDYTSVHGEIDGNDAFRMGLGAFGGSDSLVLGSSARRYCTVEFENDGEIDGFGGSIQLTSGTAVSVELFANDSDTETISYTAPGGETETLEPNMVALYVGGTLEGTSMLMDNSGDPSVPLAGDYNIGRFGFASFSDAFGLSYVIDNLVVDEIVETSVLLLENFETQTLGDNPKATRSTPGNPEIEDEDALPDFPEDVWFNDRYVLVIPEEQNSAGSGQAVEIVDEKIDSGYLATGGNTGLGWNLVASEEDEVSTLELSFDVSWRDNGLGLEDRSRIFLGIGGFDDEMSSQKRRDLPARFYGDGVFELSDGSFYQMISGESYKLTVYLNDFDNESLNYADPSGIVRLLSPNTGAFFIDGIYVGSDEFRDRDMPESDPPLYPGDNNIGRVGFATATNDVGGAIIIDNLVASEITPATGTPALFVEDFEAYEDGAPPTATKVKGDVAVVVEAANEAGGGVGKGLRFQDLVDESGAGADYGNNFTTVGNVHISLDAAWSEVNPNHDPENLRRAKIRVGQFDKQMSSGSRSYFDVGLTATGMIDFPNSLQDSPPSKQLVDGVPVHIEIFVNDHDTEPLDYRAPSGEITSLPAESYAVYADGAFLITDDFDNDVTDPITGTAGDETLGRFAIVAASNDFDIDYTIDNVVITEIAEISTDPDVVGPVFIVVTPPDAVELTFASVVGNEYEIFSSTPGLDSFESIGTVTAVSNPTTFTRNGVTLGDREFFRVEDLGPPAP